MEIGPVQNNESLRKGTCDSPARQKGVEDRQVVEDKYIRTQTRAELADLADLSLITDNQCDSYAAGTVDAVETAAEEAQLYDSLADSLAVARSNKGLAESTSGYGRVSRLELVQQRIAEGFYESRSVKEIIAQKLADEFEGSKPQHNEIEDDS
ncbi:MAG TPA: hypothetical protein PLF13_06395 [candidate division Zixibacteria bacterium]|nr:hypothetical protein [candidate division Zixibacteria bacterium]